jgi:mannose-6-phosphate isomerase-like protein (cupin superfamily)
MPIIVNREDMRITRQGAGWKEITIADSQTFGAPAMIARRWLLEPEATGPELLQGDVDQLLYVIQGSGTAVVDDVEMPLADESMLWLEPGERYRFVAGTDGLEILQGYAPGG